MKTILRKLSVKSKICLAVVAAGLFIVTPLLAFHISQTQFQVTTAGVTQNAGETLPGNYARTITAALPSTYGPLIVGGAMTNPIGIETASNQIPFTLDQSQTLTGPGTIGFTVNINEFLGGSHVLAPGTQPVVNVSVPYSVTCGTCPTTIGTRNSCPYSGTIGPFPDSTTATVNFTDGTSAEVTLVWPGAPSITISGNTGGFVPAVQVDCDYILRTAPSYTGTPAFSVKVKLIGLADKIQLHAPTPVSANFTESSAILNMGFNPASSIPLMYLTQASPVDQKPYGSLNAFIVSLCSPAAETFPVSMNVTLHEIQDNAPGQDVVTGTITGTGTKTAGLLGSVVTVTFNPAGQIFTFPSGTKVRVTLPTTGQITLTGIIGCLFTGNISVDLKVELISTCELATSLNQPCDDGSECTSGEVCNNFGQCAGTTVVCTTSDPCKVAGTCIPASGCPALTNKVDGTTCNADGSVCTVNDSCQAGSCTAGSPLNCNDNNPCTSENCDSSLGCQYTTPPCSDGDACTSSDMCDPGNGECGGTAISCDDSNACTQNNCNPGSGCDYSAPTDCDDHNACTADSCDTATGCMHTDITASCNDGNGCTTDSCDTATGCVNTNNTDSCSDGSECTTNDTCSGGVCVGGEPPNCEDNNPCTDDTCQPLVTNGCVYVNNTASCSDGSACTDNDTCGGGSCQPGTPRNCDDTNACTNDSCDGPEGGNTGCVTTPVVCTGDACQTVSCDLTLGCQTGTVNCDDSDACTDDSCDPSPGGGCQYAVHSCDDSDACTDDSCEAADGCHYAAHVCDDGDACTNDSCTPADGCHVATRDCNDSNACTDDSCDGPGGNNLGCLNAVHNCDDGEPCTTDSCDTQTGCQNPFDVVCTDGSACTSDACIPGIGCSFTGIGCDDSNACTTDTCVADSGCVNTPLPPASCADLNPCTDDSCNTSTGCFNVYSQNTCLSYIDSQCPCHPSPDWVSHGQYVCCVAKVLNNLKSQGYITDDQRGSLQSTAAKSICGGKGAAKGEAKCK